MPSAFLEEETNQSFLDASPDPETGEELLYLRWVAYGVIAPLLIAFGIVGNVLNLIVLTRPNLRGVMYMYLTWLAISDLMSLVFTIPTLLRFLECNGTDYASAFYHAHFELAIVNAFMACSVFIVVAVTVDRYVSVSQPTKFKKVHTPERARICITASYVGSFLLYIPVCFYKEVKPNDTGGYVAVENKAVSVSAVWTAYLLIKESLVRLGPTVALSVLNIMIIIAFHRVVKRRKALLHTSRYSYSAASGSPAMRNTTATADGTSGSGSSSGGIQEERRLVMLLIAIVVMFVVTMTPAAFLTLLSNNERNKSFGFQAFRAFANNMEFVNYAMNFYLYCLCSSEIRNTFLQLFHLAPPPALHVRTTLANPAVAAKIGAAAAATSAPVAAAAAAITAALAEEGSLDESPQEDSKI